MNFIVGEKFYNVTDLIYSNTNHEDYNKQINTFSLNNLKEINIVYLHTMYKDDFFDIIRNLSEKFIVVTHNSDVNIDSIDNLPDNIIKWYSQNINVKDNMNRLESLPIGLENSRWFPELNKKGKIIDKVKEQKSIRNLVYMNHNIQTNVNERVTPFELFKNKSFITVESNKRYDDYIDSIYNHKFVICPDGNGIDTHRKWEALYLKTIPIEKRCINSSYYKDLPICLVDSWEEVTEEFLNREYNRITNTDWNMDMLDMFYWENKIYKI